MDIFSKLRLKIGNYRRRNDIIRNIKGINKYTFATRENPNEIRHCLNCEHCRKDIHNIHYCANDRLIFKTNRRYVCNMWK